MKELLNSKKFVVALLAVVTAVAVRLGVPEVEVEELIAIVSPFLTFIGAQGFADIGKSRALVESEEEVAVVNVTVDGQELELDEAAILAVLERNPELIKELL